MTAAATSTRRRAEVSADQDRSRMLRQALELCRLLASEPLSLRQIAERMGFDRRMARRYVYALQLAGIDISIAGFDDETDLRDPSEPVAFRYRLDRRAWAALLWLPED